MVATNIVSWTSEVVAEIDSGLDEDVFPYRNRDELRVRISGFVRRCALSMTWTSENNGKGGYWVKATVLIGGHPVTIQRLVDESRSQHLDLVLMSIQRELNDVIVRYVLTGIMPQT